MSVAVETSEIGVTFSGGLLRRAAPFHALRSVSISIPAGTTLGLVGESGSGKTTLGRVLLGLQRPSTGHARIGAIDPAGLTPAGRRAFSRQVQCVFQDSNAAFDPRMTLGASVREGLDIHRIDTPGTRDDRVRAMFERVGLPRTMADRYPHEVSGGQRQRANIARSLILDPAVLIADEPVSALDVSVQAQILDLLADLRDEAGLTMLLITHDLGVVREMADTVAVMSDGTIVECGSTADIFTRPDHPHTKALLNAAPGWN